MRALRPALNILRPVRIPLRPARIVIRFAKKIIKICTYNRYFCVFRQLMNCRNDCTDLCPCFLRSPTELCTDLVSFAFWIVPEFWSFAR